MSFHHYDHNVLHSSKDLTVSCEFPIGGQSLWCSRVSTTPGNLLEFEIAPGNAGNLLEFGWCDSCSWKILACRVIFSTLCIGKSSGKQYHYDLREFIIPRSFVDITIFTCILILYDLSHKNLLEFFKNVSRISPGNGFGWICRHPVQDLSYNARMSHMCHICSWWMCLKRVVHHLDRKWKSLVVIVIAAAVATAV